MSVPLLFCGYNLRHDVRHINYRHSSYCLLTVSCIHGVYTVIISVLFVSCVLLLILYSCEEYYSELRLTLCISLCSSRPRHLSHDQEGGLMLQSRYPETGLCCRAGIPRRAYVAEQVSRSTRLGVGEELVGSSFCCVGHCGEGVFTLVFVVVICFSIVSPVVIFRLDVGPVAWCLVVRCVLLLSICLLLHGGFQVYSPTSCSTT